MKFIKKSTISLILFSISIITLSAQEKIIVPAIHIPEQTIPGTWIKGYTIPATHGSNFSIPEIVIPDVYIPEITIPAVNTASRTIHIPDHAIILRTNRNSSIDTYQRNERTNINIIDSIGLVLSDESRCAQFNRIANYANDELLNLFLSGDLNDDNRLSLHELQVFQVRLERNYRYINNSTALRPDQFLSNNGGDCEDWSLMTGAFCRFWGWDAYVATFFPPGKRIGHAIAIVKPPVSIPSGSVVWNFRGHLDPNNNPIADGQYIPVDYAHVGGFSSAMSAGMEMTDIFYPDYLYGVRM